MTQESKFMSVKCFIGLITVGINYDHKAVIILIRVCVPAIAQWIRLGLNPAVLGSNPKHTSFASSFYSCILYLISHCLEKRTNIS